MTEGPDGASGWESRRVSRRRAIGGAAALAAAGLMPWSARPARAQDVWVQTHQPTELWSNPGPDAISFGKLRQFSYLRLHSAQQGERYYVYNPRTQNFAYVDASVIGPAEAPPADYGAPPQTLEAIDQPARVIGSGGLWSEPIDDPAVRIDDIYHNQPLWVKESVRGEDGDTWYRLDDGSYVWSGRVRLPPAVQARGGNWIHVSLRQPTIVTAYQGGAPVYSALALTGIGGWETPPGNYVIQRRVPNERMRGPGWDVPNVLFTQYFTGAGHALHYNYWSSNFGYQGSRGCLGMNYADSLWFWNWAGIGTPLVIQG